MPHIAGVGQIKSRPSTRSRSIPLHMNQPYINLFMLRKERDRLEKEGKMLSVRLESILIRLREIESNMGQLQNEDKRDQKKRIFDCNKPVKGIGRTRIRQEPAMLGNNSGWKIKSFRKKEETSFVR